MVLSILIPVYNYNVFPLVKRLVAQINELSEPIEIRVYEDGSTNYLEENKKVEEFLEVIYKRLEINHGRTALRSKMAEDARSRWLLFLDSDVLPKNNDFLKKIQKCRYSVYGCHFWRNCLRFHPTRTGSHAAMGLRKQTRSQTC